MTRPVQTCLAVNSTKRYIYMPMVPNSLWRSGESLRRPSQNTTRNMVSHQGQSRKPFQKGPAPYRRGASTASSGQKSWYEKKWDKRNKYVKRENAFQVASRVRKKTSLTRQSEMANTSPRHMPVLGNVHLIKDRNKFIYSQISLLARVFILLIDTATEEVPVKNIWKKLSVQFLRYAIELLHVKRRTTSDMTLNDVRSSPHLAHW